MFYILKINILANQILEFNIRIKVQDRLVVDRSFILNSEGLHIYYGDQQRTLTVFFYFYPFYRNNRDFDNKTSSTVFVLFCRATK